LANMGLPPLTAVSAVGASLTLPALAHLLLAFPSGRLPDPLSRSLVVTLYTMTIVLGIPAYLFDPEGLFPPFAIADLPVLVDTTRLLQSIIGTGLMVVVATVLVMRLRAAEPQHRRVLAWLYSYGIFAVVGLPLLALVLRYLIGADPMLRGEIQFVVIAGVPVFFALGVIRGGFSRTAELEDLSGWLAETAGGQDYLGAALASALGDPSLRLYFWAPEHAELVDAAGVPAGPADARRNRQTIMLDERTIGAIDYDAALLPEPKIVANAGRVVAIAIERERLNRELLASQRAVLQSRERLAEASDRERRRIAQDLHDGLQAQLVLLAVEAQRIATAPPDLVRQRSTQLRQDIDDAAAQLRSFVHDLVPAALIERGLEDAAADLVDRMPIPTALDVRLGHRPSQAIESTAYFVLAESLTNAVKHSEATHVSVTLERQGATLHLEVVDDGCGGASQAEGRGLGGMRDRIETLGGTLSLHSPRDGGTVVRMEMPCGS